MTTKFRAHNEDELPNLEFRSTKEEALADAVARAIADHLHEQPHPPSIIVEEVRDAVLSDFFDAGQLIGVMRESMQEKIGNDDAFSDGTVVARLAAELETELAPIIASLGVSEAIRIDGYITVSRMVARDWANKAPEGTE